MLLRRVLCAAEQAALTELPKVPERRLGHCLLDVPELALGPQHRGGPERIGFALELVLGRFPGIASEKQFVATLETILWIRA